MGRLRHFRITPLPLSLVFYFPMAHIPESNEKPLSRAPAKRKILTGFIAGFVNLYFASGNEEAKFMFMAGVFLIGYGIVGCLELALGESLVKASNNWDSLKAWEKFIVSFVVILLAVIVFISLIPVVAKI